MDYPVMLYLGGLHSHAIAHNEDEVDALKERGYVTHAEAVKIEPKATEQVSDEDKDQLAEAYEHIELLEGAIEVKDKKILDLTGELEKSRDWNEHLTEQSELQREDIKVLNSTLDETVKPTEDSIREIADLKAKLAIYEETKDVNGDGVVSYDEMEKGDLKALLDDRGVKYVSRDGLDDLIQKAKDSE